MPPTSRDLLRLKHVDLKITDALLREAEIGARSLKPLLEGSVFAGELLDAVLGVVFSVVRAWRDSPGTI